MQATAARGSALAQAIEATGRTACPLLDADTEAGYLAAKRAAADFSLQVKSFLQGRDPASQAAWLKTSLQASRETFQPWTMEILYTIAVLETARFGELETLLGISTRTLATRLKSLRAANLIERRVLDTQPVATEYVATKQGRTLAALASPLFTFLNVATLAPEA